MQAPAPEKPTLILPCDGTGEMPMPAAVPAQPVKATTTGTRWLSIGHHPVPLSPRVAANLLKAGLIYECGEEHDLHVMPEGPRDEGWDTDDVLRLVLILSGFGPEVPL